MAIKNIPITDTSISGTSYRHFVFDYQNGVPAGKSYAITTIMICNKYNPNVGSEQDVLNATTSFDMYIVADGETVSPDTSVVVRRLSIPAGETFTFDSEKIILGPGDNIVIDGIFPGNLVVTVSYLEV